MEDLFRPITGLGVRSTETLVNVLDIFLVSFVCYRLLALIRGSRAWRIVLGVIGFVILLGASRVLGLNTLNWILDKATLLLPVAVVILLLPELRQALEGLGKVGLWSEKIVGIESTIEAQTVEELVAASAELAAARTGALVVIERGVQLNDIVGNGVPIEARVSAPLIGSIFFGSNPLHDGAAVIRNDRIVAAACRLPLSENPRLDPALHMRHRAAIGVTEAFDCVCVVVSEERGTISVAYEGKLLSRLSPQQLREELNRLLRHETKEDGPSRQRRRSRNGRATDGTPAKLPVPEASKEVASEEKVV